MDSKNGRKKQTKKDQSETESTTMRASGPIESSSNGGNGHLYDAANIVVRSHRVPLARDNAEDLYMQLDPDEHTCPHESKRASSPPPKDDPVEEMSTRVLAEKRKSPKSTNSKDPSPAPRKRRNSEILPGYHYIIFLLSGIMYWGIAVLAVRFYKAFFPADEPED